MWLVWIVMTLHALVSAAAAEIYAYTDSSGVTHFTNLREEIPEAERERARVVVGEAWRPSARPEPEAEGTVRRGERELPRQERDAGLRPPAEVASLPPVQVMGGTAQIQGPLVVGTAESPVVSFVPAFPWVSPGLVSTSFDRGRSRHRTLRLLMEETVFWPPLVAGPVGPLVAPCPYPILTFAGGPRYSCLEWRAVVR